MTWEGTSPHLKSILLNSHTDVVPVYQVKWQSILMHMFVPSKCKGVLVMTLFSGTLEVWCFCCSQRRWGQHLCSGNTRHEICNYTVSLVLQLPALLDYADIQLVNRISTTSRLLNKDNKQTLKCPIFAFLVTSIYSWLAFSFFFWIFLCIPLSNYFICPQSVIHSSPSVTGFCFP